METEETTVVMDRARRREKITRALF